MQDANGSIPLNPTSVWKVWLKIDDCTDEINQAFALTFNEIDTLDDLKTRVFEKLNSTRWSALNDNASIAIGFPMLSDEHERNQDEIPPLVKPSGILGSSAGGFTTQSSNLLNPTPLAVDSSGSVAGHRRCYSVTTSPQRSMSNSPRLGRGSKMTLIRHGSASPYGKLNTGARKYSPVALTSTLTPEGERFHQPGILNEGYQFPSEESSENVERPRVLFEPDELVINIYRSLFDHMGSQKASEALLIVCNEPERILEHFAPPPAPPVPLDTLTAATYIPTNEEITQHLLETQSFEHKDSDDYQLTTPPETDLALGLGEDAGHVLLRHSLSSEEEQQGEDEEEREREFKLITNEEQLRKESQSLQDADRSVDSPKPAILLLPRDYEGDVDFNDESDSQDPAELASPATITYNDPFKDPDRGRTPIPALDENEVGLIHPMLESERKKRSCPASPDLPKEPDTVVPRLPSQTPSTASLQNSQLPWSLTSTTNYEIFPKITVLIVEDNVINQAILRSFLKKHKISYKVAKNGQEAVDRWKEGGIDLIFMDLQLPVFSGMDAAKKIRDLEKQNNSTGTLVHEDNENTKKRSKAPVIIVAFTASNTPADKREALLSGCNDYLTKPVNLHWLSKKINEWGCMQALIDFDSWKQGQSRMTDSVLKKTSSNQHPHKQSESGIGLTSARLESRSNSNVSQIIATDRKGGSTNHTRHSSERGSPALNKQLKRDSSNPK